MKRDELKRYLAKLLNIYEYNDYCPNGLQIEGKEEIKKVAFAVSATRESIEKAIELSADTMIVHHGLFWKFHGTRSLTGAFGKRVMPLVRNEMNLFGYHLPLDAHMEYGNAHGIAKRLGLTNLRAFGDYKGMPTGVSGNFETPLFSKELCLKLKNILNHEVIHSSPDDEQEIRSIGIITGGANSDWISAQRAGLDAYLTGEISEHDWHEAKESDIHFFAGGHNATESFGVQDLMEHLQTKFEIECFYIESSNPA